MLEKEITHTLYMLMMVFMDHACPQPCKIVFDNNRQFTAVHTNVFGPNM